MIKGDELNNRQATTTTNGHATGDVVKDPPRTIGEGSTTELVIPLEKIGASAAARELAALRARIEKARELAPPGAEIHCGHCFGAGRRAAIATITGENE